MIGQGLIQSVHIVTAGSYLAADAALSATSLVVESILDFSTGGGQLALNGVTYVYTAADYDTETLTLSTGLTGPALTADRVDVFPLAVEKIASVSTAGPGDAVSARIPHALVDRIPEGIRAPGEEESVQYSLENGEFIITDVIGREPVIAAEYIDPALTTALTAAQAAVDELNTVTLPALQTELDGILPITETDIADDAITTPKIAANAVTAAEIAANTITANEMAADSITANEVAAGAIDGMVITGTWIRTAASGARISLNDPAYPTETVYYTNNPDETAPGRVRPIGVGGAALSLRGPDVTTVASPATFDLGANNTTGKSSAELDADNVRVFGTDTQIDGFTLLRLGDGTNYIKFAGHTIDAETGPLALVGTGATTSNGVPIVTTTGAQALTNKDLTGAGNTFPSNLATLTGTQALTNKDLSSGTNTYPGRMLTQNLTAACTANVGLTTTEVDITGATVTFTTTKANATYLVTGSFYFAAASGAVTIASGKLNVDGTNRTAFAQFTGTSATTDRVSASQTWTGTLASAGSHTLKLRGVAGASGVTVNDTHTTITVMVFE